MRRQSNIPNKPTRIPISKTASGVYTNYLGRDATLLQKLSNKTGLKILKTRIIWSKKNKHIPQFTKDMSAKLLAEIWIDEFKYGIDATTIRPGFIKIGVDNSDPLEPMDKKLVKAAALTHLKTGLIITSHTGEAKGLWPQLKILKGEGVSPKAFIWIHAQNEVNVENYRKAYEMGCWISFDGFGWEIEKQVERL